VFSWCACVLLPEFVLLAGIQAYLASARYHGIYYVISYFIYNIIYMCVCIYIHTYIYTLYIYTYVQVSQRTSSRLMQHATLGQVHLYLYTCYVYSCTCMSSLSLSLSLSLSVCVCVCVSVCSTLDAGLIVMHTHTTHTRAHICGPERGSKDQYESTYQRDLTPKPYQHRCRLRDFNIHAS
jgi:hypothetical protein